MNIKYIFICGIFTFVDAKRVCMNVHKGLEVDGGECNHNSSSGGKQVIILYAHNLY